MKIWLMLSMLVVFSLEGRAAEFYYDGAGDPTLLVNWGSNADGSGTAPLCFCGGDDYYLTNVGSLTLTQVVAWTFLTGSTLHIGHATQGSIDVILDSLAVGGVVGRVSVGSGSSFEFNLLNFPTLEFVDMAVDGTVEYKGNLVSVQTVNEAVYGNLIITGTGTVDFKELPDTLTINGNLTLNGYINTLLDSTLIRVQGDVTVGANFGYNGLSANETNLEFIGAQNQTVSSSGGTWEFNNLYCEKTNGFVRLSNVTLDVHGNMHVDGSGGGVDPYTGKLTVEGTSYVTANDTLLMSAGSVFIATGDISNAGVIEVEAGASAFQQGGSFVQLPGSNYVDNGGVFKAKNNVGWTGWTRYTYWSSPVSGVPISNVPQIYSSYEYTDMGEGLPDWQWASGNFSAGRGYALQQAGGDAVNFTGPVNTGTINGPQAGDDNIGTGDENWTLVGNPYPSAIHAATFLNHNSAIINGAVYIWDQSTLSAQWGFESSEYTVVNGLGVVAPDATGYLNAGSPLDVDDFWISSFQGFFVEGIDDATPAAIQFTDSMRHPSLVGTYTWSFKNNEDVKRAWLTLEKLSGELTTEKTTCLVGFHPEATDHWDPQWDARNLNGSFALSTLAPISNNPESPRKRAVIQSKGAFNSFARFPVLVEVETAGNYRIALDTAIGMDELGVFLIGSTTITPLKDNSYEVFLEPGQHEMELIFMNGNVNVENFNRNPEKEPLFIRTNKQLIAKNPGVVMLYDIRGKLLDQKSMAAEDVFNLPATNSLVIIRFNALHSVDSQYDKCHF